MAGSKCVYLELKLLDLVLGGVAFTPAATLYALLSTAAFDPTATGAACNEYVGNTYARVAITNNTTSFPVATGGNPGDKANGIAIAWPAATADWATMRSAYLADASAAGNLYYGADFSTEQPVVNGQTFQVGSGIWVFQET